MTRELGRVARISWVCADEREGASIRAELGSMVVLGVGKTAAAVSLTRHLERGLPDAVVVFGVCGAYPEREGALEVGDTVLVGEDVFADEGVQTEATFLGLGQLGLGDEGPFMAAPELVARLNVIAEGIPVVRGATVSTCSGTNELSRVRAERSGARVETMEGAAVGWVCRTFGVPWVQLRSVSNRTGDRAKAGWDLHRALRELHRHVLLAERALR